MREIINSLRRGEADAAMLEPVRLDSSIRPYLARVPGFLSRDYLPVRQIHRIMNVHRSAEDFYRSLSSKHRKNLRWQAKKLLSDYSDDVKVVCFRQATQLDGMIRDVEEIAKKTYQRRLGVGFVDNTEARQLLQLEAEKGWLRGYVLYVAGQPCAFWVGILYKATFYSEFLGYDPRYAKYSPGMFLVTKVIEDLCNNGAIVDVDRIDFGLGDAQYKENLGNEEWQEAFFYLFAPTIKGVGLNLLRTPTFLVDELAKKILEWANLLPKIKKMWRGNERLVTKKE
ncbi:MAG: GNAT family N-acetyltransferase [Acidobacteriota bacterium]